MRSIAILIVSATPCLAASGPFLSLGNTDFIVLLSFLLFLGVLVYLKVPGRLLGLLDKRAAGIRAELDEAKALREEAQTVLAGFERKQLEVQEHSSRIVEHAKEEARLAAAKAKEDITTSMARRVAAAEEQIASAHARVEREVRDQAIRVAVAAARDVIVDRMTADTRARLIDEAIDAVETRLH